MTKQDEQNALLKTLSMIADITGPVLGALIFVFVACVFGKVSWDAYKNHERETTIVEYATDTRLEGTNIWLRKASGQDAKGRKVAFVFLLYPRTIRWTQLEAPTLSLNNTPVAPDRTAMFLFSDAIVAQLKTAQSIILPASTSQSLPQREVVQISGRRAATLAAWTNTVPDLQGNVFALNLGHYKTHCAMCQSREVTWKDNAMLVLIKQQDKLANVKQALQNAMRRYANIPAPDSYTAFSLTQAQAQKPAS